MDFALPKLESFLFVSYWIKYKDRWTKTTKPLPSSTNTFPVVINYCNCLSQRTQEWSITAIVYHNVPSRDQ